MRVHLSVKLCAHPFRHHSNPKVMATCSLLFIFFLQGLLPRLVLGQQRAAVPWRHRIQWATNGQVYSLMSTGSEFQAPARSRGQSRFYVSSRRDGTASRAGQSERTDQPGRTAGQRASGSMQQHERPFGAGGRINSSTVTDVLGRREAVYRVVTGGEEPGLGAQNHPLRAVPAGMLVSRQPAQTDQFIPLYQTEPGALAPLPALSVGVSNEAAADEVGMVNDDPRNPFKTHRNSVFYNMYPSRGAPVARTPGSGYGTRYFQNGKLSSLSLRLKYSVLVTLKCFHGS